MTATPPQGTDRDALHLLAYEQWLWSDERPTPEQVDAYVDRILALVRPVEGITLTPEEAHHVVQWLDMSNLVPDDDDLALAARLEAAQ